MMLDTQILLVDLNATWSQATAAALSKAGYTVQTAVSFQNALQRMTQNRLPDLMVLSFPLDNREFIFRFCKNVQTFSDLPVLLVADRRDPALFARALNEYAEDIVVDSVSSGILVARIGRLVTRFAGTTHKPLNIDWPCRQLRVDDTSVNLSPTESRLLHLFLRRQGEVVNNEYIVRRLWPSMTTGPTNVRTAVHRLRSKLAEVFGQDCIINHQGGYRLQTRATHLIGMPTD